MRKWRGEESCDTSRKGSEIRTISFASSLRLCKTTHVLAQLPLPCFYPTITLRFLCLSVSALTQHVFYSYGCIHTSKPDAEIDDVLGARTISEGAYILGILCICNLCQCTSAIWNIQDRESEEIERREKGRGRRWQWE